IICLIILLLFGLSPTLICEDVYYNIAHMLSTKKHIDWALSQGANAVEADLHFENGFPKKFSHGPGLCECSFEKAADWTSWIPGISKVTERLKPPVCQVTKDPC